MSASRSLEFDLSKVSQAQAFANLCAALNQAGVPFSLRQEQAINRVAITIGEGY
jgi:hypothetical protein